MLAHMNNVQPKANLPSAHNQKYTNAMPQRNPKAPARNLTGLYLGVDGDKQMPQSPKSRVRGMPSRRVKTPTEERRYSLDYCPTIYDPPNTCVYEPYVSNYYPNATINVPHFPPMPRPRYVLVSTQKKVDMLRIKEDKIGFAGNPVNKNHQGRGLLSTEEMTRGNMYPKEPNQFWDVTKQTNRQFTSTANSGVRHLEYLNADPNDAVSGFYPRAFNESLDDVLIQEIQAAVQLRKEVTGLIHCYNKICKGNSEALQNLLPNRPANASRPNTFQKTGFSIKSYRTPAQAEIDCNFPAMEPRPKTVTGAFTERPLVPSPYFFKMYNPPKTAGPRPSPRQHEHHHIVALPGAGRLSQTMSRGRHHPPPQAFIPPGQPRVVKTTTMQAEDIIPPSPRRPCGTPMFYTNSRQDKKPTEKVEISLPVIHKTLATAPEEEPAEMSETHAPRTGNPVVVVPPIVIGVEDFSNVEDSEQDTAATETLMKLQESRQSRHKELASLLNEHAQIIQEISTQEEKPEGTDEAIASDSAQCGSAPDTEATTENVMSKD